ncbi:MAG: hypothetical protein IPM81_12845 [Saprospirales bacterium]|nr:hypothetical protein [Saprospirales bacterium]
MQKKVKGGNVVPAEAAARVDINQKCALVGVETPNAPAKPKIEKAPNIDAALGLLDVKFKVNLRRLDGTAAKEEIRIETLSDFEESTIVQKSNVLRAQKLRMEFMHEFQNELRHNPVFRAELAEFLKSEKREEFVRFLQNWVGQMKKPSSAFLQLLRS